MKNVMELFGKKLGMLLFAFFMLLFITILVKYFASVSAYTIKFLPNILLQ